MKRVLGHFFNLNDCSITIGIREAAHTAKPLRPTDDEMIVRRALR